MEKNLHEKKPAANRLLEKNLRCGLTALKSFTPCRRTKKKEWWKIHPRPHGSPPPLCSGGLLMFRGVRPPDRPLNPNQQPNRKRKKIGSGNLLRSLVVIAGLIGTPAKPGSKFPSSGQKRIRNGQRRGNSAARERKGDMYTTFFKGKRVSRAAD